MRSLKSNFINFHTLLSEHNFYYKMFEAHLYSLLLSSVITSPKPHQLLLIESSRYLCSVTIELCPQSDANPPGCPERAGALSVCWPRATCISDSKLAYPGVCVRVCACLRQTAMVMFEDVCGWELEVLWSSRAGWWHRWILISTRLLE